MFFYDRLKVDKEEAMRGLGYQNVHIQDKYEKIRFSEIAETVERASAPRWVYVRLDIECGDNGVCLAEGGLALPGNDIAEHLAGCHACFLLAATLGSGVEQDIRAAEATNMAKAVVYDMCASVLIEQYAAQAQQDLTKTAAAKREYCTQRFSPGYGDFPIELQADILRLLDAPRAIGLTTNQSSILLPRKSVTAVMGIANHAVSGRLAGCENCKLHEKCGRLKGGKPLCGKPENQL